MKADSCHQGLKGASHVDTLDRLMMFSFRFPLALLLLTSVPTPPRPCHRHRHCHHLLATAGTLRTQARPGDFVCIECGKTFHQPGHLRAHMRAHSVVFESDGPRGSEVHATSADAPKQVGLVMNWMSEFRGGSWEKVGCHAHH
ncbi:hypothetical protein P7K49_027935 [Saguinus oedipus]|uniref:C2H2-type domain-containing protein n=1 Tax=Saguinus oedipus TaxID=9490 RepID=A0ABQ9UAV9_SAGOE|nr:hypothetical protein P7K49_027935 [Saguinus oedipus]